MSSFKCVGQLVGLIGLQFGDEGKGKLVDLISSSFDYVVRYQGGDNAGHTIYYNGQKCVLRSIPSGIFNKTAIIAPGIVVNPFLLLEEISQIESMMGCSLKDKLFVSDQANVICNFHIEWDKLCEKLRGDLRIGSTLRGIGPAYSDKAARIGIKLLDCTDTTVLKDRLKLNLELKNPLFQKYGFTSYELENVVENLRNIIEKLNPYLIDYYSFISRETEIGKTFLLEGSQGLLLDIDLGTYPFVTSSSIVSSMHSGAYFPLTGPKTIIGVVKIYMSRVGAGPLPTEFTSVEKNIENMIRERGNEYGSNTRRARRLGWLDLNLLKYAIKLGGVTDLALTMVDVFNNFDNFKVCTNYKKITGEAIEGIVAPHLIDKKLIPEYKTFKAWTEDFFNIKNYSDFSQELKDFISFLESEVGVKVSIISFGKNKEDSIFK